MTTGKHAVEILRKFYDLRERQGDSHLEYDRCKALGDLRSALEQYVSSVEGMLDEAYNGRLRREGWVSASLSRDILRTEEAKGLRYLREENVADIREMDAFKELERLAQDLDVLFLLCMYENKVAAVLDLITEKGRGTVSILFL